MTGPRDEDRDDVAWLLEQQQGSSAPHPDPERGAAYLRLQDELRNLPPVAPPPGLVERLVASLPPDTPARRLWRRTARRLRALWRKIAGPSKRPLRPDGPGRW